MNDKEKKLCPLNPKKNGDFTPCIGSKCAVWRWKLEGDNARVQVVSKTEGYCGLGGKE